MVKAAGPADRAGPSLHWRRVLVVEDAACFAKRLADDLPRLLHASERVARDARA
jgi:hypothetical protein